LLPHWASSSKYRAGELCHHMHACPHRSRVFLPPPLIVSCYTSPRASPPPRASRVRLGKPWYGSLQWESLAGARLSSSESSAPWTPPLHSISHPLFTCTSTALCRGCSRAPPFIVPWLGTPHRWPPAPPLHHAWWWPASQAP
jgi:hypothetical protein